MKNYKNLLFYMMSVWVIWSHFQVAFQEGRHLQFAAREMSPDAPLLLGAPQQGTGGHGSGRGKYKELRLLCGRPSDFPN